MRKYVFSLFLLSIAAAAFCQKKSVVNLIKSKSATGVKIDGKDLVKVYLGTFRQDFSTLTSDSAYFYPQDNAFDAFGHVIINQGDTLNIYSDKLNYNGNTKIAILTDNVRMVDKDATLTTNHLNYNTATRIGTYTDGGKLVNKDNVLTSKNGYYFAFTRDSYFRYNVVLTSPDALVKTDTMRYNTGSKIAYFYGPTHIYGTKGKKDNDTLYTENGTYNTGTEQAAFGKNNLYTAGTKSLTGDSLFYDKLKGYGRAVKHVTFADKEQKTTIRGNLGTYFKAEEKTIMTDDPYVIIVTEQKDTTQTDSAARADSLAKKIPAKNVSAKNNLQPKGTPPKDVQANTAAITNLAQVVKNTIPAKIDTVAITREISNNIPADSLKKADAVIRKLPSLTKTGEIKTSVTTKKLPNPAPNIAGKPGGLQKSIEKSVAPNDTGRIKRDSIYMSADTIETQIMTYKDLKIYQEKQRLSHVRDTSARPKVPEKESKFLTARVLSLPLDTTYRHKDYFGKPKPVVVAVKPVKPPTKKQLEADSLKKKFVADSVAAVKKLEPADTARIRILIAHHHAKLFKSDMQAKADSMFYSYSDSTLRCYVNPIIWAEGSQLSGDTAYMRMKQKKLYSLTMFPNAFIVNIEKGDSVHFNQVGGKKMRGYFVDNKLHQMYVDGNAESIYFARDSGKTTVSGMERSLSSRMRVDFKNNQATNLAFYTKPEHKYGPLNKFKEDDKLLKGFIWKPELRPVSKESIIPSYSRKKETAKEKGKTPAGKPGGKQPANSKMAKDSTGKAPTVLPKLKTGKDSTLNSPAKPVDAKALKDSTINSPAKLPPTKTGKDSTIRAIPVNTKKDSVITKPAPAKIPF